jgi:pterin-4a-carbinolamine dehydratase
METNVTEPVDETERADGLKSELNTRKTTLVKLRSLIASWLKDHPSIARQTRKSQSHLKRRWRDLTSDERLKRAFQFAEASDGLAFTLNLSPAVESKAEAHPDPAGYLKVRLNRQLRKHGLGALPFGFVLEISKPGKLHAHGIIVPTDNAQQAIKNLLRDAGGQVLNAQRARQLHTKQLYAGVGYLGYIIKGRKKTTELLSGRRSQFMNDALMRASQEFHENNRPRKQIRSTSSV